MSQAIRLVSYNCRGLRNTTIPSLLNDSDIILLQETFLCKQDLGALNSLSPFFQGTGASPTDASVGLIRGRPRGGVAILYRKTLAKLVTHIELGHDWISAISIKLSIGILFYILSVYLPYHCPENEEEFISKIDTITSIINDFDSPNTLVMGDF